MAVAVVNLADGASLWQTGREQGVRRMRWETHPELVREVCAECLFYNQTVWDIDDPDAPEPPLHPMCACQMVPEFDEGTLLGQDPDGNPIIADAPPVMEPGEWLARAGRDIPVEAIKAKLGDKAADIVGKLREKFAGTKPPKPVVPAVERYAEGTEPPVGPKPDPIADVVKPEVAFQAVIESSTSTPTVVGETKRRKRTAHESVTKALKYARPIRKPRRRGKSNGRRR